MPQKNQRYFFKKRRQCAHLFLMCLQDSLPAANFPSDHLAEIHHTNHIIAYF